MVLRTEDFWKLIENELNQDGSELIALHTLYMLNTYKYISRGIKGLHISQQKYDKVHQLAYRIVTGFIPKDDFEKLDHSLFNIVRCFSDKGVKDCIRKLLDFLKEHPYVEHMTAISGILNGVLNTEISHTDYFIVNATDRALNNIIMGKEVDDIG